MMKDSRRILTWSLNAGKKEYQDDLEKYHHKIYSIGLHEFGVTREGKIYDFRSERNYFDASGNHSGVRFPIINETHMIQFPTIKWFTQIVLFGWSKVQPVLNNDVPNSEGRLPQDQFVLELNKILDIYETSRNSGQPLNLSGVEMDVEASMTSDYTSANTDVKYIAFLEKIKNEVIIPRNLKMRVNVHAMWGESVPFYYRFHNYKLFAESADKNGNATIDEIQLMTYDFAWNGSSAGASTPIWWFKDVANWCVKNFDPKHNPKAKLTMDNLFFGAAGYGHRWGMHDQEAVKRGSTITFRNLLGWMNGQYRHYHTEVINGKTEFIYHDQDYIYQTAFQDDESKNEVMYPHVYDMFEPKYADVKTQHGGQKTATVSTYNSVGYAASNFKLQVPIWAGVKAVATKPSSFSGKAYPLAVEKSVRDYAAGRGTDVNQLPDNMRQQWDTNVDPESLEFNHLIRTVDDVDHVFVGWYTENRIYKEKYEYDKLGKVTGAVCELEDKEVGKITYSVNIPSGGSYSLVAITSFSWYTQAKVGGFVNGSQEFVVGGDDIPEWYPFFLKGSHFYDCGKFNFNSGTNTIVVDGEKSAQRTPIYGFIVCENFDQNFSGGELKFNSNIQPMKKKDESNTAIPKRLALAAKMLRRDARPAILWDDEFRTYGEGTKISDSTYYPRIQKPRGIEGAGDNPVQVGEDEVSGQPIYKCMSEEKARGYTQGVWRQKDYALHYNYQDPENASESGQLILSKQWTVNLSIEARINIARGRQAGIRFYSQTEGTSGDGYVFYVDFDRGVRELSYEDWKTGESHIIASQKIGNVSRGQNISFKVLLHNGVGYFYVGGVQAFVAGSDNPVSNPDGVVNVSNGTVKLKRTKGAVGIYANQSEIYCRHLGISTTDRWETLEKFEVVVDGEKKRFGRIQRSGYEYDEFAYLIYSGLNEKETRDVGEETSVSLDYEVTVLDWASWQGAKEVTIKLRDAGVWFGELLIGDREGMSIIWAGDAWSFLDAMNMAVNDYGAKGIGLWTMGQEDPTLFELVPDVVPKYFGG